jgi:hypothetical protein
LRLVSSWQAGGIFYTEHAGAWYMPPGRWLGWAVFTVLIGSLILRHHRKSFRQLSFWLMLLGLLVLHVGLYILAFAAIQEWRAAWYLPITLFEFPIFQFVLYRAGYR